MENKSTSTEIKQKNRTAVFQMFRKWDQLSRQDIVAELDLSLPTVTLNLQQLLQEGLIEQTGSFGNTGGRRARAYSLVADARTAIGLDITQHHVTAVAMDLRGKIIASQRHRLDFSRSDDYSHFLGDAVSQIAAEAKLNEKSILGVGIGVPGLITPDHQTVSYGEVLGITGAACEEFSRFIPYPTALYHDTDAASFAEMWVSPDIRNAFYIMLSASVGGTIYIDGKRYGGSDLRAGEVGHMMAVPGGKRCYCGQRGCVDPYCAAPVLASAAGGDLKQFFRMLKRKDARIQAVWQEYLEHLATVVANLRMLFDCDIIIGGYVGSCMDEHIDDLRAILERRSTFDQTADYVQTCRCKTEAIAAGAALNYISAFLDSI